MKKAIAMLLALVMLMVCAVGCGAKENGEQNGSDPNGTGTNTDLVVDLSDITIGACVMSLQHEFMCAR